MGLTLVTNRHSQVGVLEGRVGLTLVTYIHSQVGVLEGRVGLTLVTNRQPGGGSGG